MTGTAMTEDKEFMDIYGMDVVEIPTNKPMIRVDHEDAIYMTKKEKLNAVINDIVESHKKGQPVLVGTINIDTSEEVSELLSKRGIKHNVLNAKFHELERRLFPMPVKEELLQSQQTWLAVVPTSSLKMVLQNLAV